MLRQAGAPWSGRTARLRAFAAPAGGADITSIDAIDFWRLHRGHVVRPAIDRQFLQALIQESASGS